MSGRYSGLLLIISDKPDRERDALASAWEDAGGEVLRLGRFWDPPPLVRERVRLYGSDSFSQVLAQKLGLALLSPRDEQLAELDEEWLRRSVRISSLGELEGTPYPAFVKPVTPKLFRAGVYSDYAAVQRECQGLESELQVLVAEVVSFQAEARCFVLDGRVLTSSIYAGSGDPAAAQEFATRLVASLELPKTCVADVGFIAGRGWGLVEFNASWGAGLNGCDPVQAAQCIAEATFARA